jgi:hypothetical protein
MALPLTDGKLSSRIGGLPCPQISVESNISRLRIYYRFFDVIQPSNRHRFTYDAPLPVAIMFCDDLVLLDSTTIYYSVNRSSIMRLDRKKRREKCPVSV